MLWNQRKIAVNEKMGSGLTLQKGRYPEADVTSEKSPAPAQLLAGRVRDFGGIALVEVVGDADAIGLGDLGSAIRNRPCGPPSRGLKLKRIGTSSTEMFHLSGTFST